MRVGLLFCFPLFSFHNKHTYINTVNGPVFFYGFWYIYVIFYFLSNEAVEDIKGMFKKIDTDENDTVTIEELKIVLQKLNLQLVDSEIQLLIEVVTL